MSICSPCLRVCAPPLCVEQIILGTISSADTDVRIIIANKTKGGKQIVSTQSDGDGIVTLVTSGLGLMAEQTYEISVILATATALCDTETLTIGSSTATCVHVLFENIKDTGGCQVSFESQTLTVSPNGTSPNIECCYLGIFEGTYAQVVAALAAGIDTTRYSHVLITNFQTVYDQPDFDNTGTAKVAVVTKTSAVTEPLLIPLLSSTKLQAEAYSALYPKDQLRYDITFDVTEVMGAAAKGRISERIDHLNNRTDYDHRHVVFKRYESAPASGIFNQYKDNGGTSQEFTTFQFAAEIVDGFPGGFSNNNYIGDYAILKTLYVNPFLLSNNIFGKYAESNKLPNYAINSIFGEGATDNIIDDDLSASVFGDGFRSNHFRSVYTSVFGDSCSANNFYHNSTNTTAGNNFNRNQGGEMIDCTFGNSCINNNFGAIVQQLTFVHDVQNNIWVNIMGAIDFTLATHVYAAYSCTLFHNQAIVEKLYYIDAGNNIVIVNANA